MKNYNINNLMEETKKGLNDKMYNSKIDGGSFCDYDDSNYICDIIMEISDYNIDIYNYDLFEWAKSNYSIIEEANEELGTPTDIIKQIQQGEYLQNMQDIYDNMKEMLLLYCYNLLKENGVDTITEEQNTELEAFCEHLDNDDYLPSIDSINEALNYENQ